MNINVQYIAKVGIKHMLRISHKGLIFIKMSYFQESYLHNQFKCEV